ncbi:MAG: hypothetical protein ABIB47_01760 [Candidatus Woesearchaeota archaeon]
MKKISILLITLLLVGLIPLGLAESNNQGQNSPNAQNAEQTDIDKAIGTTKARVRQLIQERKEIRLKAALSIKSANTKYEEARVRFRIAKDKFQGEKTKLQNECVSTAASADEANCENIKNNIRENTKNRLLHFLEGIEHRLEKLTLRIQDSKISDDKAEIILENIEEAKAELSDLKQKAENLTPETTWNDYKELSKDIKEFSKRVNQLFSMNFMHAAYNRLNNLVTKLEVFEENVETLITDNELQALEEQLAQYKVKVIEARNYLNKAKESWEHQNYQESKGYFKGALVATKETNRHRKEIRAAIRGLGNQQTDDELDSIESELKNVEPSEDAQLTIESTGGIQQ